MFCNLGSSLHGARPISNIVNKSETNMLISYRMNMACIKYENKGNIYTKKIYMSKMTLIVSGCYMHYRSNSEHKT
jgi:hypothetical protein